MLSTVIGSGYCRDCPSICSSRCDIKCRLRSIGFQQTAGPKTLVFGDVKMLRKFEAAKLSTGTVVPHYAETILFVCYRAEAATRQQQADVIMYCCCPPMTATRPVMINTRFYAITASQFVDKPRDASASVARGCSCEFASVTLYIRNGTRYPQCYYRT